MPSSKKILKKTLKSSFLKKKGVLLALLPLLFSCSSPSVSSSSVPFTLSFSGTYPQTNLSESPLKIIVASDLHYLAPELHDQGAAMTNMVEHADGKVSQYGEEVLEAFLSEVEAAKPDALFLTGDLSFNGEKLSHEHLAEKLLPLEEKGIAVLVLPGNHDIDSSAAYFYRDDVVGASDNVDKNSFLRIYAPVTYEKISSFDPDSLSYVYPLRKDLRVLSLSADADEENRGGLSDATLLWAKSEMEKGDAAGVKWITLSHESLLKQNPLFTSFSLKNASSVAELYRQHQCLANFSGHLHIQHFVEEDTLSDICSSSLLVSPSHYGVVELDQNALHYHTENVDVAGYWKKKGSSNSDLLNYATFAEDFFRQSNQRRMVISLEDSPYSSEEKDLLLKSYGEINYRYFAGEKTDESYCPDGFKLWRDSTWGSSSYVRSMLDVDQKDYNSYQKSFGK